LISFTFISSLHLCLEISEGQTFNFILAIFFYNCVVVIVWWVAYQQLKLWARISVMARCTRYNFMW